MRVLDDYNQPNSASSSHLTDYVQQYQQPSTLSEHIPASIQHLLADARPVSNAEHLTSISRASSAYPHRQERVLSTGYNSSNPSPTVVPFESSHSKRSSRLSQQYTPRESPIRSHVDNIYWSYIVFWLRLHLVDCQKNRFLVLSFCLINRYSSLFLFLFYFFLFLLVLLLLLLLLPIVI
jgi:hypothetical protein